MSTADDDKTSDKKEQIPPSVRYECLGDALDAMDMGIKVDEIHLRDLAAKSVGPFESELAFENADGTPMTIDVPCKKNPGHASFIPVSKFKPENIPEQHRTQRFYETVLTWTKLVVRVVVKRISRNRPEVYSDTKVAFPDSDQKLRGTTRKVRYGSGYVVSGFGSNQPYRGQFCPCHLCRDSGQRREFWSLNIATVTHVIYDSSEARDSVFEFFYDSEDKKGVDFMYGVDSFEQVGKNTEKICIVRCVTHDRDLFKRIFNIMTHCSTMAMSREEPKYENDPVVLISHPHGKCKCVTIGRVVDFIVPVGTDFHVCRPITFTKTAECKLPLKPWSQNSNSSNNLGCCNTNSKSKDASSENDVKETTSSCPNQNGGKSLEPLPVPIKYPSDIETYMEALGSFVINTGKNQNVLSPGMFNRESENNALVVDAENQNKNTDGATHKFASMSPDLHEKNLEDVLDHFYEACNFRCVNVDKDTQFTTEDIYFGSPAPSRDMQLRGLIKSQADPEPDFSRRSLKMDVLHGFDMYQKTHGNEGSDSDLSTKQELSDSISDSTHPSQDSSTNTIGVGVVSGDNKSRKELGEDESGSIISSSLTCSAMCGGTSTNTCNKELDEGPNDISVSDERESGKENKVYSTEKENTDITCKERDISESGYTTSCDEVTSERENNYSVEAGSSDDVSPETNKGSETGNGKSGDGNEATNYLTCMDHRVDNDNMTVKDAETSLSSSQNNACSEATADLSLPEMLQILVDKGINLFPESDSDSATGVDMLNALMCEIYQGDGLPLVATLNKIYEDVATKNIKPLTLDPGSQFNLPKGTTFTLPENAEFALRFHDLTSSWFSFQPGTVFHTAEREKIDIPNDAEFSFKSQSVVQGFMTYRLDSCPGSSGGLIVLGKGQWIAGHVAHSGQYDCQTHENRSSLRRWMIYLN